jgi:hypothetical protein
VQIVEALTDLGLTEKPTLRPFDEGLTDLSLYYWATLRNGSHAATMRTEALGTPPKSWPVSPQSQSTLPKLGRREIATPQGCSTIHRIGIRSLCLEPNLTNRMLEVFIGPPQTVADRSEIVTVVGTGVENTPRFRVVPLPPPRRPVATGSWRLHRRTICFQSFHLAANLSGVAVGHNRGEG